MGDGQEGLEAMAMKALAANTRGCRQILTAAGVPALLAERDRLREALERIAAMLVHDRSASVRAAALEARKALDGGS